MRFRSLLLKDFKGFVDETIDLDRPLTVLVGPNGSGKSSILDALAVLASDLISTYCSFGQKTGGLLRYGAEAIDVRNSATVALIAATISEGDETRDVRYKFSLDPSNGRLRERSDPGVDATLISFFSKSGSMPLFFRYSPGRRVGRDWRKPADNGHPPTREPNDAFDAIADVFEGDLGFTPFLKWFYDRENIENELKVSRKDLTFEDPQLGSVRRAVGSMLPGYDNLRIQREPLHLVVTKQGVPLYLDQLSDGEKSVIAMVADIARRLAMSQSKLPDPLQAEAVVVIDEVDLHLHPAWQRSVVGRLVATFPNCQFIVTTHSPQVVSEVPSDSVIVLHDFKAERPAAPTSGRDSNAILQEVLEVTERPQREADALLKISSLIDDGRYADARSELDDLAKKLTEQDGEIVRLRSMLHFLESDA